MNELYGRMGEMDEDEMNKALRKNSCYSRHVR